MGKLFNFFSGADNRSGSGVSKAQVKKDKKMGLSYFFYLLRTRLGKIAVTNMIFTLCNFSIILFVLGMSGTFDLKTASPSSPLYSQIYGMEAAGESSPILANLFGIFGNDTTLSFASTTSNILMLTAILLIFTLGLSTIGMLYNFRSISRGEPISSWSDFFPAIKKNFKQGLIISILDAAVIVLIAYDLMSYYMNAAESGSLISLSSFYIVFFFALIYYVMRFYIYLILITFDIKFTKMLKNSLFLVFLGWKRSLACIGSSALIIYISFVTYKMFPTFGILLPFVLIFGLLGFIGVYCAYPIIDEYMIQPYYKDHPEELPEEEEIESIFTDRG